MAFMWQIAILFFILIGYSCGQSSCPIGHYVSSQGSCIPCPLHTYKAESGPGLCIPCPYSEDGFQLHTTSTGSVEEADCTDLVYIADFFPKYGPKAGGTVVNITIAHLHTTSAVDLVQISTGSDIIARGDSWLSCQTGSVGSHGTTIVKVRIFRGNGGSYWVRSDERYEYRPNPQIHSIDNPVTIASGGGVLTVNGEDLDSCARPVMIITRIFRGDVTEFTQECDVISPQLMICGIPDLTSGLGDEFWADDDVDDDDDEDKDEDDEDEDDGSGDEDSDEDGDGEQDLSTTTATIQTQTNDIRPETTPTTTTTTEAATKSTTTTSTTTAKKPSLFTTPTSTIQHGTLETTIPSYIYHWEHGGPRKRRDADPQPINGEDVSFWVGFQFDGITYANISTLEVYENPVFFRFEEENTVQEFSPEHDEFLIIRGERLNLVLSEDDVTVQVGEEECDVTSLTSNRLTCYPPTEAPDPGPFGHGPDRSVIVIVIAGNLEFVAGYVLYVSATDTNLIMLIAIVVAVILFWAIFAWLMVAFFCPHVRKRRRETKLKKERLTSSSTTSSADHLIRIDSADAVSLSSRLASTSSTDDPFDILDCFDRGLRERILECELSASRLEIGALIGIGNFARVWTGTLKPAKKSEKPKTVAVKTLKELDLAYLQEIASFLKEALLMRGLQHPNILALYGVMIRENVPFVIFEYMDMGDLKFFLLRSEKITDKVDKLLRPQVHPRPTGPISMTFEVFLYLEQELSEPELLNYSLQIAQGMAYMSALGYIHRDLAARNCLINSQNIVKIGDFGLARDLHSSDYYRVDQQGKALPVKWMAIETLMTGRYDTTTDVWSFGVLLWELFSNGRGPYPDVQNIDLKEYLEHGHRLSKPAKASQAVFDLMSSCWEPLSEDRPAFREIVKKLKKMISSKKP